MAWKYKCGHESNGVFLNNEIMGLVAYFEWRETVGVDGDMSQCFGCFCDEISKTYKKLTVKG